MADMAEASHKSEKEQILVATDSKVKQLQAFLTRKDIVIKDLRDKLEEAIGQERDQECRDLIDKQTSSIQSLRRDLQCKQTELNNCQQIAAQVPEKVLSAPLFRPD